MKDASSVLTDLENALIDIESVAATLRMIGDSEHMDPDAGARALTYIANQLGAHREAAYKAFSALHSYAHNRPNQADAGGSAPEKTCLDHQIALGAALGEIGAAAETLHRLCEGYQDEPWMKAYGEPFSYLESQIHAHQREAYDAFERLTDRKGGAA